MDGSGTKEGKWREKEGEGGEGGAEKKDEKRRDGKRKENERGQRREYYH